MPVITLLLTTWSSTVQAASDETEVMPSRLERVAQNRQLRVCIWPEYFSISYVNDKSGALQGIDIDLARAFASDLGVSVKFVKTHFGRFMDDLEQDACDIGMFGIGRTPARMKRIDFSQPYLASSMYALTTRTHRAIRHWEDMDKPGHVICVQKGTYMEGEMKRMLRSAQLSVVLKPYEREIEVRSGRADAFITDYPYGQKMLKKYDWARLLPDENQTKAKFKYAYAIAKNQPAWLQEVNIFVERVKSDGRLRKYAAKHNLLPILLN